MEVQVVEAEEMMGMAEVRRTTLFKGEEEALVEAEVLVVVEEEMVEGETRHKTFQIQIRVRMMTTKLFKLGFHPLHNRLKW